ncbi:hypothetical protein PF007_g13098, partial [Phytophthora fragariae]
MTHSKDQEDSDIWRDSLVRYLGYANELGESFRPIVPRLVVPSYLVAFGYVLGDTFDKANKAHAKAVAEGVSTRKRSAVVADATIDTLAWQTMASVVIPGFTINRVVAMSSFAVQRAVKTSPVVRRWAPTAIGLGVIPLIIHPIDSFVDVAMDQTVRKWSKAFVDDIDQIDGIVCALLASSRRNGMTSAVATLYSRWPMTRIAAWVI